MKSHKPAALAANILKYAVLIVGAFFTLLPSILILTVFTIYPLIKAIVMSFQEG